MHTSFAFARELDQLCSCLWTQCDAQFRRAELNQLVGLDRAKFHPLPIQLGKQFVGEQLMRLVVKSLRQRAQSSIEFAFQFQN